ncbi:aminotransferase class V-fold PLP-dependent enzyme [bacterium]|nr:aminotransferase class V-fold PLP-dependent enzyme [bacterium]
MTIYFDNSATTQVRKEVAEAMFEFISTNYGNPSSIHAVGRNSYKAMTLARKRVAGLLNCSATEICFAGCGTLANNLAILGRARFVEANDLGRHIITSRIEHSAVTGPARYLEAQGWKLTVLDVDKEGFIKVEQLMNALTEETSIISIMWANNEIGTLQPIKEMAQAVQDYAKEKEREIFFHTDAVQAAGKVPIDLKEVPVSALSISGHKFHAPKGVGALFLRRGVNLMPITFGGGQEKGLMPGTESMPNIVALGMAAELAAGEMEDSVSRLREMQNYMIEQLSTVPGVHVTGTRDLGRRLPGHVSVAVENCEGEALVMQLDLKGICCSSASACHKGIVEPSHVLSALNLPCDLVKGSVRISMGKFNTMEECREAVAQIKSVFESQKLSVI